jgi:hypothetical protein
MPMLAFSWGNSLQIVKIFESRIKQNVKSKTGKLSEVEIGTVAFEKFGKWDAKDNILALQWLNHHVRDSWPIALILIDIRLADYTHFPQ